MCFTINLQFSDGVMRRNDWIFCLESLRHEEDGKSNRKIILSLTQAMAPPFRLAPLEIKHSQQYFQYLISSIHNRGERSPQLLRDSLLHSHFSALKSLTTKIISLSIIDAIFDYFTLLWLLASSFHEHMR